MNIDKDKLEKIKASIRKHAPNELLPDNLARVAFNLKYGSRIDAWIQEGYSDDDIVDKIIELESK